MSYDIRKTLKENTITCCPYLKIAPFGSSCVKIGPAENSAKPYLI